MNIITTKNELLEAFTSPAGHCLVLYMHQDIVLRVEIRPRIPRHRAASSTPHLAIGALRSLESGLSVEYLRTERTPRITSLGLFSPRNTEYYLSPGAIAFGHPALGEIPPRLQEVIKQALEAFSEVNDAASRGHGELLTKLRELKSTQYT